MSTTRQGTVVRLPKLGESVTEGTIGAWLRKVGDSVEKYDPLVEITTDKVSAEVPAPVSGVLVQIQAEEGQTLPVGAEICVIDDGSSATAEAASTAQAVDGAGGSAAAPAEAPTMPSAAATPAASARPRERSDASEQELLRTRSSPAVRRIAEEHGIDISQVHGTGHAGRVTKQDILKYIEQAATAPTAPAEAMPAEPVAPAPSPAAAPPAAPAPAPERAEIPIYEGDEIVPVSAMRRQIAQNVVISERTAPHVTAWMDVDMSGVVAARERVKARFREQEGFELTYLPFVIRAVVGALREHPNVNAVWDEDRIIRRKAINIGVAVGMEDGLIVPVIRNADEKSLVGLARAVNDLASRARANRLSVDEVQGGTFTVNNPGTFGTILSTPIIVQPQAAILSTEAIVKRPVVVDDAIAIRSMMTLSLSLDHRILDGLIAARFLASVKKALEAIDAETPVF